MVIFNQEFIKVMMKIGLKIDMCMCRILGYHVRKCPHCNGMGYVKTKKYRYRFKHGKPQTLMGYAAPLNPVDVTHIGGKFKRY